MKKKLITNLSLIYVIIMAVYVLAVLISPFEKTASSWIAFGFTVAAFPISFAVALWAFRGDARAKSLIYGFPIFKLGVAYAVADIAISLVFYILGAFVEVPVWITVLVFIAVLAAAAVVVIMTSSAKDTVEAVEEESEKATKTVTYFNVDIASILDRASDKELKAILSRLADDFKYSDPVSSDATAEKEAEIKAELDELSSAIDSGDNEAAKTKAAKIKNLLADRNRICKASK